MTVESGVCTFEREKRIVSVSGNLPQIVAMALAAGRAQPARVPIIGLVATGAVFWDRVLEVAAAMAIGAADMGVSAE